MLLSLSVKKFWKFDAVSQKNSEAYFLTTLYFIGSACVFLCSIVSGRRCRTIDLMNHRDYITTYWNTCHLIRVKNSRVNETLSETPSQSYEMSLAVWDHIVLPATRHKWTPRLNPSQRPVLDLPIPAGWKAELTWVTGYIPAHRRSPI